MSSLILRITAAYLIPLLLLFSILMLVRGHNNPGGGFIGGLLAVAAFSLYAFAYGIKAHHRIIRPTLRILTGAGLFLALASGMPALWQDSPFMTGQWRVIHIPLIGGLHLGTPLLFDFGVYLVVMGAALTIIFTIMEK